MITLLAGLLGHFGGRRCQNLPWIGMAGSIYRRTRFWPTIDLVNKDKILKALAKTLWKIGAWVLVRIAKRGLDQIVAFIRERADHFAGQAANARTAHMRVWLDGRAKRWREVASWLARNWKTARKALRGATDDLRAVVDAVPKNVPLERKPRRPRS